MTFDEALALLEIDEHVSLRQAKRAYLKQVKRFKPEQDPAAFQRVREAYELVTPILNVPVEIRQRWASNVRPEYGAVSKPPGSNDDSAADLGSPSDGTEALDNDGAPQEPDGTNEPVDREVFDEDDADATDNDVLDAAPVGGNRQQMREWLSAAMPQLLQAFEAARDSPDVDLPVWSALQAVAMLAIVRHWEQARALRDAIDRWQSSAATQEIFRGGFAARWALLSDLVNAGPNLDSRLVQPVARSLLLDDANIIAIELRQYQELSPDGAKTALLETQETAPLLHDALAGHLEAPPGQVGVDDSGRSAFRSTWPFWVGLVLLFNVVRLIARVGDSSPAVEVLSKVALERASEAREHPPQLAEQPLTPPFASAASYSLNNVERARSTLYAVANAKGSADLHAQNERVFQAFLADSCDELGDAFAELEGSTRGGSHEIRDEVQRYWAEYLIACPNHDLPLKKDDE